MLHTGHVFPGSYIPAIRSNVCMHTGHTRLPSLYVWGGSAAVVGGAGAGGIVTVGGVGAAVGGLGLGASCVWCKH